MRISVIVPAYNALEDYRVCIESLAQQTVRPFEVIWVDSSSTDGSADAVARDFPWVQLIREPSNKGYRGGARIGAKVASGTHFVVLNQDVECAPRFIEELQRPFNTAAVGMTAPLILLYSNRNVVNEAGNTFHFSGLYGSRGLGVDRRDVRGTVDIGIASGCCFCIRAELWEQLGGFSDDIDAFNTGWHAGNEDHDLCWRLRLAGYKIQMAAESVLFHKYSRKPWASARLNSCYCCYWLTLLRLPRWRTIAALAPFAIFNFFLLWVQAVRSGWVTVRMLGNTQLEVLCRWSEIMKMRQRIQKTRVVSDRDIVEAMEPTLNVSSNRWAQVMYSALSRAYYVFFVSAVRVMNA